MEFDHDIQWFDGLFGKKKSEKTPFFDPYFGGDLQMTQGNLSDDS